MPVDLLRHVIGPTPYSGVWLWVAVVAAAALIVWYTGVFMLTRPGRRPLPLVGAARAELVKRRFARAVRRIGIRYRERDLASAAAGAALSREVRAFLHAMTGARAQYMQVDDIAAQSTLAPAAPLLADLTDVQFNMHSTVDVAAASDHAEELIRTWT